MKYLILTASAGNGHNSAAKTIKNKILKECPTDEVQIVDAYKEFAPKINGWIIEKGYFIACKHLIKLYNLFFKQSEKNNADTRFKNNTHNEIKCFISGLLNKIYDYKPDVIISTYIFVSVALDDLKRIYNIPAKMVTLTLDYGISPYWECTTIFDKFFITGEYMREPFKKLGFQDEQMISSGIVIDEKFNQDLDKKTVRDELKLNQDLFTIVVMKGGFFTVSNYKLMQQFSKVKQKIQIILINGKDEFGRNDLDRRISRTKANHVFYNLGFVNNVDKYFSAADLVLGKAGGLSTTEAINKGIPSVIVDNLPQQEIYNKDFLVENECALSVDKSHSIGQLINYLLENPQVLENMRQNNLKLRNKNTSQIIYDTISSFEPADYSLVESIKLSRLKMVKKLNAFLRQEEKKRKVSKKTLVNF